MRREITLTLTILSILILSGCTNTDTNTKTTPYVGGTTGLVMSFITGAPPDDLFDKSQMSFGISVKLENKGESDVKSNEAYVEIIGMNPSDYGKTNGFFKKSLSQDLTGVKKNFEGETLNGGITSVEFSDLKYTQDLAGNMETKMRAEVCYNYKTKTTTEVCIKKNLLQSLNDERICDLEGEKSPQNSGGPVHITSLKETPMGENKIQFLLVISHVGDPNGRIYKQSTDCDSSVTNTNKNKVYVKVNSEINGKKPTCTGFQDANSDASEGYVTLYDMAPTTLSCTVDVSGVSSIYESPLNIELSYRYSQFIEKSILIKDVTG